MYHKMTFEIDNEMLQSYNDRRFKKGDIVFFIRNNQGAIDWGEVETVFCDRNVLTLYELRDERTVEGIPIKDYNFNPEKRLSSIGSAEGTSSKILSEAFPAGVSIVF